MNPPIIDYSRDYLVQNDNSEWFRALAVPGDGNCFFHAVSYYVKENHRVIRQKCTDHIRTRKNVFANFMQNNENIDEYIEKMSKLGTYAEHIEIASVSVLYNLKIRLFVVDSNLQHVKEVGYSVALENQDEITLMYYPEVHFWPLVKVDCDPSIVEKYVTGEHELNHVEIRETEKVQSNSTSKSRKRNIDSESVDSRKIRLEKDRSYKRERDVAQKRKISNETVEERNTRLEIRRSKRKNETSEQRELRLKKQRDYQREYRAKRKQKMLLEKLDNHNHATTKNDCTDDFNLRNNSDENDDDDYEIVDVEVIEETDVFDDYETPMTVPFNLDRLIAVDVDFEKVVGGDCYDDDDDDDDYMFLHDNMPTTIETFSSSNRKKRNSALKVFMALKNYDENMITEHYLGKMSETCPKCQALHFKCERNPRNIFMKCCSDGNTKLAFNFSIPCLIEELLTNKHEKSKHFRENIRQYNSTLSFASFGAHQVHLNGRGPYCFKIQGVIYHLTSNVGTDENVGRRQYAQLYIVDTDTAVEERLQHPANRNSCDKELLKELDKLLRATNKYAEIYKLLGELEREERERCARLGIEVQNYHVRFVKNRIENPKRYNLPACNEIAVVFKDQDGEPPFDRDIEIHSKDGEHVKLPITSEHVDPMTYALLYPSGDFGWNPNMKRLRSNEKGRFHRLTHSDYYAYLLSVRNEFASFLHAGKLTQQYIVDAYAKMEANRLHWIRQNQNDLRSELYDGLYDYVHSDADADNEHAVGKRIILPSSFNGSARAMAEKYQDAMSIVTEEGTPDLFITFTANPRWPEITENLESYETTVDRPDIVARVFDAKKLALRKDLHTNEIFGEAKASVGVVEVQKRGLLHEHQLFWMKDEYKIRTPEHVDKVVCAEIPDVETEPELYNIVCSCMIHGPCGNLNPMAACMKDGRCSKGYPKEFCEETVLLENSFPKYRRRNNGRKFEIKRADGSVKYTVDNRWIVPYNKYLSRKYRAHINVEICASVHSVKYLFMYIHKGHDAATIALTNADRNDEILTYLNTRFVSPIEAFYRIYEYRMHYFSHVIKRLAVHLENKQAVCFHKGREKTALEKAKVKRTTLMAWFELNKVDTNAHQYYYREIPKHYTFHQNANNVGTWELRKNKSGDKVIGRLYNAHVRENERFFLRLLLLHQKGCTSFEDVRTVEGKVHETNREAATALGLLKDDNEWDRALAEAVVYKLPRCLRLLFATICLLCSPNDPLKLWKKYLGDFCEDFTRRQNMNLDQAEEKALLDIGEIFAAQGKSLEDFGLPKISVRYNNQADEDLFDASNERESALSMLSSLTTEQKIVFDAVIDAAYGGNGSNLIFLNAAAGTGKTYLYECILHYVRGKGDEAVAAAWTGLASSLLQGARTVHYTFKLPVPLYENSTSSLKLNSNQAKRLRKAKVILIDEVTMVPHYALDTIDTFLKEVMNEPNLAFGGKVMVLGGDFMQTLPIVKHGSRATIVNQTVKNSRYWFLVKEYTLTKNMRLSSHVDGYAEWLLKVGKGELTNDERLPDDLIEIPSECIVKENLVTEVFGEKLIAADHLEYVNKIILAPKNSDTLKLNRKVLKLLDTTEHTYYSADSIINDDAGRFAQVSIEYLNRVISSGLPEHELKLKVGAPIILLRNMNPSLGLYNGTRLRVTDLKKNVIKAEIITGKHVGETVFIPRIILEPLEQEFVFQMRRVQFPVRLAFSMTINKAQGQTIAKVGLYLPSPVFAHGQLYVGLSRGKGMKDVRVSITNTAEQGQLLKVRASPEREKKMCFYRETMELARVAAENSIIST